MKLKEFDINVSTLKERFPAGTHVLLFGVNGLPDGAKGEIDFIVDIGHIFVETENGFENVVLRPDDMNIRFVRDCVNYDNIVSNNFVALSDVELEDGLPGVCGYIEVKDFLVAHIPELAYCLSLDNDDWVNGRVSWNMEMDEVTLLLFNDAATASANYIEKELVLTGKDKDWVVNAFNKHFVEEYGLPTKVAFEQAKKEEVVFDYLNKYPLSPIVVVNDPGLLNRINVCCDIHDLGMTKKIIANLAENACEPHTVSKDVSLSDFVLSDDGKYISFDVQHWVDPSFEGVFRISDAQKGADMKLVSIETNFGNEVPAVVKKQWNEIEAFVRKYVDFKGLNSKVASIDNVIANAKANADALVTRKSQQPAINKVTDSECLLD